MERTQALIEQLQLQQKQNASPSQMLLTTQLLQSELLKLQRRNGSIGTSKVAVTLPMGMNFSEEMPPSMDVKTQEEKPREEQTQEEKPKEIILKQKEPVVAEVINTPSRMEGYSLNKPIIKEETFHQEQLKPVPNEHRAYQPVFDPIADTPTLMQHQPKREVHETIAGNKESLNDRLNESKKELAHVLKESPIKDLRKGIGINDRFHFVTELFRGDDAMYERSIKTINGFNILSEAEYWMNRELKVKLGWNDSKDNVQHFYHLVRRRFA